jgi:hypothetical protein
MLLPFLARWAVPFALKLQHHRPDNELVFADAIRLGEFADPVTQTPRESNRERHLSIHAFHLPFPSPMDYPICVIILTYLMGVKYYLTLVNYTATMVMLGIGRKQGVE